MKIDIEPDSSADACPQVRLARFHAWAGERHGRQASMQQNLLRLERHT
jgi:hypothetical protein